MKKIFAMDLQGKILIAIVFMVLGFMLSVQYKVTVQQRTIRMDRVEDLSERLKGMETENKLLLQEINELRAAGAEAISLNDQRIVAMSEVRCAGPTVSVNNVRSAPPYVIKAIGAPKTLTSALRLRGGVAETFEFWGIQVKIKSSEKVRIPALKEPRNYKYAKNVEGQQ